ncbi:MAG: ABC transporter ATP-binding protein [Sulfolobales archaeon]
MAFIEIKNLYYRYPTSDTWMLKGVSLRIGRERVVVTGSTGSGKTTLLRVISGLAVKVYGGDLLGEVRVEGRAVYVPQNFDLYVLMPTAREELTYILANQGLNLAEVEAEIRRLSDLLGIKEVLDQNVMKLSMGQRQRIAIASALSLKPDILLLDEPFAHIDPKGVVELTKIL